MYTSEKADNTPDVSTAEDTQKPVSPAENTSVDQTKAFSKRLKEEVEKARADEREQIAKSYGYESWDEYNKKQTDSKLIDSGIDPEVVRPVLKDLIKSDPEYIEGMRYKEEKTKRDAEVWAKSELDKLNSKYGLHISSVDELDPETVKSWNNGMSLEKAYIAEHFEDVEKNIIENTKKSIGSGKDHLNEANGNGNLPNTREVTAEEVSMFKSINPYASEDDIKKYINDTH